MPYSPCKAESTTTLMIDRNPLPEVPGKGSYDDKPCFVHRKIRNGTCSIRISPPSCGDSSSSELISPVLSDQYEKTFSNNGSNGAIGGSKYLENRKGKVKFWDPRFPEDTSPVNGEKMAYVQSTDPQVEIVKRNNIMKAINLFNEKCRQLMLANKSKSEDTTSLYNEAAKMVKREMNWTNNERVIGPIPGVRVGDRYDFRAVLFMIGLHCQYVAGIDYKEEGDCTVATSVVDSNRYQLAFGHHNDERESSYDVLYYIGEGGNPQVGNVEPEDQKLKGGNKALMNSMKARNEVRVICKLKGLKHSKITWAYVYYGLYTVEDYTQRRGKYGKLVFVFKLKRKAGQAELNFDTVSNSVKFADCSFVDGKTSQGKEKRPVRSLDSVNHDKIPRFNDISETVSGKPSSCYRRPPTRKNWVSQHGLRYQLEIFKKKSQGWGVRSRDFIARGSFICELVGILSQDEDGKLTTADDDDDKENMDTDSDADFKIDAAECGNIGRFIKYSDSPNLYAECVLRGRRLPHVMLYASEDISPKQEITLIHKIL